MFPERSGALGLSVAEAAERLSISGTRVRELIKAGELDAVKVGVAWIVDLASVDRRRHLGTVIGRQFSPHRALGLLMLAADEPAPWLDRVTEWKLRRALGRVGFKGLVPRLRKRAIAYRLRAHPGDLKYLQQEECVVRSGPSAAGELRLEILASDFLEAYVPADELPKLVRRYRFGTSRLPNMILHVVNGPWPFASGVRVVPMPFAVVDLLESDEPRAHRAGRVALEQLAHR
jgi:excisionase family DNA binding protein